MVGTHKTLSRGGVLWGMGFSPTIAVPPNDINAITAQYVQGTKEVVVGTKIDMDGVLAAADSANDNAYMPCPMALQFEVQTTGTLTITCTVVGRNQFGDSVSESVTVSNADKTQYTLHCYSFVESITPTVVTNWGSIDDKFQVGFEHNDQADCAYPLPFRVRNSDHIQAMSIGGVIFDGADITVSSIYNTVTVKNSATNITGLTVMSNATISLVNGAADLY